MKSAAWLSLASFGHEPCVNVSTPAARVSALRPASLGTKQLELLGPGPFFRRPSSLHLGRTILVRMVRDDQRDGIVIATEQCEEAPPHASRRDVQGEFTLD